MIKTGKLIITLSAVLLLFSCTYKYISKNNEEKSGQYVAGSEDVPLFEGLEILNEETTGFDSMSGSIIVSCYQGEIDIDEVRTFYFKTLPQLGWELNSNKKDKMSYQRKGDNLDITFKQKDNLSHVKFLISSNL